MDLSDQEKKLLDYLPTGLAALIAALTAVGGLTGGIARMFRNNSAWAVATLLAIIGAVLMALLAQLVHARKPKWTRPLVTSGILLFVISLAAGLWMAVDTAKTTDRPSLSAELTKSTDGGWSVKGVASTSGLASNGSMRVLVYAYVADGEERTTLLSAKAGPNGDGVATYAFTIPVPHDQQYRSLVITAAVGDSQRFCDEKPIDVSAALNESKVEDPEDGKSSCVTLRPPDKENVGTDQQPGSE